MPAFTARIHTLFNNETVRIVFRRLRWPIVLVLAALMIPRIDRRWFLPGLIVSALGALGQLWCFGCLKTRRMLAVNGPYMFVRNPMYLARFLLILGVLMMPGRWWMVLAFLPVYYFYMVNRVRREERKLGQVFGDDYTEYCRAVPRFLPAPRPFHKGRPLYFRWEFFRRNSGPWNLLAVTLFYAACWYFTMVR